MLAAYCDSMQKVSAWELLRRYFSVILESPYTAGIQCGKQASQMGPAGMK